MPYETNWRNEKYQKENRQKCNEFLGTDFNNIEWLWIYCRLGNNVNEKLCREFINSNYDFSLLKDGERYDDFKNLCLERGETEHE